MQLVEEAEQDDELSPPEFDAKSDALIPVLKREQKAFFHAHRADDIFTAIRIANEFSLDLVVVHGTEGHVVADELAECGVSIISGPILSDRSKPELRSLDLGGMATLYKAGVHTALCTDHPVIPIQHLPLCCGLVVGAGLPYEEALKAITIYPAEMAGIADRVGSIKAGKDADLVLYEGDPFSPYSRPADVFINGRSCLTCGKSTSAR